MFLHKMYAVLFFNQKQQSAPLSHYLIIIQLFNKFSTQEPTPFGIFDMKPGAMCLEAL